MLRMNTLSVSTRLIAIVGLLGLGLAGLASIASVQIHGRIMEERQTATRIVVETALGVVAHFGLEQEAGRLSEAEAQAAAIAAVGQLRYSESEYFWINDMTPTMIMHPIRPELDGTDLTENVDPDGKHLFVEFVDVVRADGSGFVDYQWPKPGADAPQPKVSYVSGYAPWGWVIGSGVYVDDVRTVALAEAAKLLLSGLGILVLVGGVTMVVGRSIVTPIRRATEVLASGDVTTRLPAGAQKTELEQLAAALNVTLDRASTVAADVAAAVAQLDAAASDLVRSSDGIAEDAESTAQRTTAVSRSAQEVSLGIDTVASGTHQMGASISEIAQNAHAVAKIAVEAVEAAETTNRTVATLGDSSAQIGSVVKVITAIAEQTNLLALNATIEAARAGDAGKGFAVVAGEVKELAQETARATGDISARVEAIQGAVLQAAGEIGRISEIIGRINDYQTTIAGAVEEQTATTSDMAASIARTADGSREIALSLGEVGASAQRTTGQIAGIRSAAHDLAATSRRLQEAVGSV
ncbi:methyl-accepting chemotaxis protein [Actinotalea sp. K2]|uniref:methyl-accepting chemotaxis protein n=1 Tax=Actinotalea sp. K2 TaxID=2939438 RepID=UPI00201809A3|nr:methyl-accepting chemotaxis protein [Actinotalea sp. K2]MCL3859913.1 methyl-accepting chemotaxis protein [Actinotalea sp. K2]